MPKTRAHTRLDCDCLECRDPTLLPEVLRGNNDAVPSTRDPQGSIIVVIDGALSLLPLPMTPIEAAESEKQKRQQQHSYPVSPESHLPSLSQVCREGCTGLLAVANPCPEAPTFSLQLLRRHLDQSLRLQFKDISIHLLTDDETVADAAHQAQCAVVQHLNAEKDGVKLDPESLAHHALLSLGIKPQANGNPRDSNSNDEGVDMVVIMLSSSSLETYEGPHVEQENQQNGKEEEEEEEGEAYLNGTPTLGHALPTGVLQWLDSFSKTLLAQPEFNSNIIYTIILGTKPTIPRLPNGSIVDRVDTANCTTSSPDPRCFLQQSTPLLQAMRYSIHNEETAIQLNSGVLEEEHSQNGYEMEVLDGAGDGDDTEEGIFPIVRPRQSFQFSGVRQVEIDESLPYVVVHRLQGVIRTDDVKLLDLDAIQKKGGGGCILAEHVLPEIAFKLGRAPKYGA